jgi:two-component system sensor histidine kinase CreC
MAWWWARQRAGLRRYADAVSAGQRASLPEGGIEKPAGEFADLGRALESMRRQLDGKQYVERYVHTLTHELKSPLAAIRGAAELLEGQLPDADRARFAASIGTQSRRMATMVDKLLALAEVEHRQRIERPEAVDMAELAREVAEDAETRAQASQVRVEVQASDGVPTLQGDPFLLRRMLANLVDNAIDFSPVDGVVELRLQAEAGDLIVEVADRGPGIPDYALERVFERFYSLSRPNGGHRSSGLGLNFVAEIAQLHGGRASLGNRDGGGALACVVLPLV